MKFSLAASYRLQCLMLFVLGILVYAKSLGNGFLLDDIQQVVDNQLTVGLHRLEQIFRGASNETFGNLNSYGVYYRPLMLTSFNLLRGAFGLNATPFHALQLLLHILNACLLLYFFRDHLKQGVAFVCAAFFLIHPLNTEAVSYIASLQDPLFSFFGLSALLVLQSAVKRGSAEAVQFCLVVLLLVLGLLSKETAGLFALVGIFLCFQKSFKLGKTGVLAASLALLFYFSLRFGVAGLTAADHSSTNIGRASTSERLITAPAAMFYYIEKFFVPLGLSTNQDWMVRDIYSAGFWGSLIGVLGFLATTIWLLLRNKKDQTLWLFFLWSALGLGLHSQILNPLDGTVADRWFYFTSMGFVGFFGRAVDWNSLFKSSRLIAGFVVGSLLLSLSWLSHSRSLDWESDYTLALKDVATDPSSPFMQNNLGVELYKRGQVREALPHVQKAVELSPGWNIAWNNLGVMHQSLGNLIKAEEAFLKSIDLGPNALAYRNYPIVLLSQGRKEEAARFVFEKALLHFPNDSMIKELSLELKK